VDVDGCTAGHVERDNVEVTSKLAWSSYSTYWQHLDMRANVLLDSFPQLPRTNECAKC
jgi:hypothetical protein